MYYLILENGKGGDLKQFIYKNKGKKFKREYLPEK